MNINFLHRITVITLLFTILSTTANATDWLGRISDDMPVCRLSIPGTHDAATGEGFIDADTLAGNYIARTQELTLAKQWEAGIRAFDLRPDLATDSLGMQKMTVFHGEFATNTSFSAVISMLRDSLRAHPSEFAIIIMRHESSPNRESSHWADRMDYILALNSDLLVDFRPDITVGQLRGRILLLSRDKYDSVPHGAFVEGWRHDGIIDTANPATIQGCTQKGSLLVQDLYDTSQEADMEAKTKAMQQLFLLGTRRKADEAGRYTWMINHTSGYCITSTEYTKEPVSTTEGYRANAAKTNLLMAKLLEERAAEGRRGGAGIVMMDFGGTDRSGCQDVYGLRLVNDVIKNNIFSSNE